jgi:hypothetical protein
MQKRNCSHKKLLLKRNKIKIRRNRKMRQAKINSEIKKLEKILTQNEVEKQKTKLLLADYVIKNNLSEDFQDEKIKSLLEKINELEIQNITFKSELQEYKTQYYSFFLQAIEDHNITTKELNIVLKLYKMLKEKNEKIDITLLNELEKKMFFETEKEETVSV